MACASAKPKRGDDEKIGGCRIVFFLSLVASNFP